MEYGQGGAGIASTASGVALLPNTSGSRMLMMAAISLVVIGSATLIVAAFAAYKRLAARG